MLFSVMKILERSKITVQQRHTFKKFFCYGSFRFLSSLREKVFSGAPANHFFSLCTNNPDAVVFGNAAFGEIKNHSLKTTPFQKKLCYESFRYVSTLRKKVFSGAPVKCFSHCGSNNSDSVIFGNVDFAEIKDHSLRTTPF